MNIPKFSRDNPADPAPVNSCRKLMYICCFLVDFSYNFKAMIISLILWLYIDSLPL